MSLFAQIIIAALPLDIALADKEANLRALDEAMEKLPAGTDIVVLPELFSTGYSDDAEQTALLAEDNDGPTMQHLRSLASRHIVGIAGSYIAKENGLFYNRAFLVEPSGETTFYDKHHLFSLSQESKIYAHGAKTVPTVRFRGWNIALAVCYDLRFPAWCRSINNSYDLILFPANWPQARAYAWEHLLIARAIENQAAVVGANRGGSDKFGVYDDLTFIFDHMGRPVGEKSDTHPFVCATLSRGRQDSYREAFPVAADADSFTFEV